MAKKKSDKPDKKVKTVVKEKTEKEPVKEKVEKKPAPKKKKKKKSVHYVNSKELRAEITLYYETEKCTHQLGTMINKIAEGLSFAPNFINYSYKDEMVGDAKLKMFSALLGKKFNIDSEYNPFSYFTTIAFNAFINRIKKEKRQHDTITRYKEKVYDELLNAGEEDSPNIYTRPNSVDDDDDGSIYYETDAE